MRISFEPEAQLRLLRMQLSNARTIVNAANPVQDDLWNGLNDAAIVANDTLSLLERELSNDLRPQVEEMRKESLRVLTCYRQKYQLIPISIGVVQSEVKPPLKRTFIPTKPTPAPKKNAGGARRHIPDDERATILEWLKEGISPSEIAKTLNRHNTSIYSIRRRAIDNGELTE